MTSWKIFDKARGNPEATLAAMLALVAQIPHAQHVFFVWGHSQSLTGSINAWVYAIAVESATFFFVLRGWSWVSWGFALASVGVNVGYYSLAHADRFGPGFMFDPSLFAVTWSMWLLSIILPVAVAAFSHATAHGGAGTAQRAQGRPYGSALLDRTRSLIAPVLGLLGGLAGEREDIVPEGVLSCPVAGEDVVLPDVVTVQGETPIRTRGDLDDKDRAILDYLANNESGTKSDLAKVTGLTSGAIDRMKSGQRVGRMVKLEESGQVVRGPDGSWSIASDFVRSGFGTWSEVDLTLSPDVRTNGHVEPS